MGEFRCEECGEVFKTVQKRGAHKRWAHGVSRKRAAKTPAPQAAAPETGLDVFEVLALEFTRAKEMIERCAEGLTVITERARELRGAYIACKAQLEKLRAAATELGPGQGE